MNNKTTLLSLLALGSYATLQAQEQRPNILFLCVDDWNDHLEGVFDKLALTPNLNKLMKQGVAFTNAHTAASFSTPSRTALMTGMAPWHSGCYADQPHLYNIPDRITIDELLQSSGYTTLGGGKVYHHMPGYVNLDGFDEYFHWLPELKKRGWGYDAWNDKNPAKPGKGFPHGEIGRAVYDQFDVVALPNDVEKDMADTRTAEWAVEVLQREHDKPFFLAVGMYAPHKPNYVPQKYFDMHPIESIELPEVREDDFDDMIPDVAKQYKYRFEHHHLSPDGKTGVLAVEDGWRKAIQGYLAACSYSDAQLGKVLEALYKSPYADNTIIIFWSDNGYHLGEKKLWAKHTMWERTTNVPMIVAGKGVAKNKEYKGVVSLLDIFPTIIEECGLSTDEPMDGVSLSKILDKPRKIIDRKVITADRTNSFSITSKDWHYIYNVTTWGKISEELYDTKRDINEFNNLAYDAKYADIVAEMKAAVPQDIAPAGANVGKNGTLRLMFSGERFKWVLKKQQK